jgi:hypothetical protein
MLFMVSERFKPGKTRQVSEQFRSRGRMLPEGVSYLASWVDPAGSRCFQVMEASQPKLLDMWLHHWDDLFEFEVVAVQTSGEFWAPAGSE